MSVDKYTQNLEKLFSQIELPKTPAVDSAPSTWQPELEALRKQVAELEAQAREAHPPAETARREAGSAPAQVRLLTANAGNVDSHASSSIIYESDRVSYAYTGDSLAPFLDPIPAEPGADHAFDAPLLVAGRAVGAMRIESSPERAWNSEERHFASAVAHQLSLQVENLRLLSAAERARAEAEAANRRFTRESWASYLDAIQRGERIGYAYDQVSVTPMLEILTGNDLNHALQEPMLVAGEQIGALYVEADPARPVSAEERALVSGVARQLSQQVENLRLLADAARARAEAEEITRRLTREHWQEYAEQHHARDLGFVYDRQQVTALDAAELPPKTEFALVQPLTVRGETIGQLVVADNTRLASADAALAEAVATRLSAHIENLRLLEETELGRQQLQKRAAELQAVAQVSATASTALEADKLLQSVVDLTRSAFGLYHAHVYLLDDAGENLVLAAGAGEAGRQMLAQGWTIPLDREQSLVARAARTGRGVTENDVRAAPDFLPNPWLPDTRSELAAPLIAGDRVLGVFGVQSHLPNHFTEEDVRIQTTLAAQVAVALQNARLYSEQTVTTNRLREMDRLKSTFLANMSHELRTPLNSVIGYTDVILEGLDGPLSDPMETDLRTIQRNGQHLLNLINDVLDMAKIESGKLSLAVRPFDLRAILAEIIDITSPLARDKNVELRLETRSPSLGMEGDDMRLRQVVMNVVNNAIKFTESGGYVAIQAERVDGHIRVQVRDTGIGISPDKLDLVFQEFMQVDASTTRKVGGTGLGLPISRHLIALHGGRLWAESAGVPGQGSTFTFEVPVESQIGEARTTD